MPRTGNTHKLRLGRHSQPGQIYHIRIATWQRQPILASWPTGRCVVHALRAVEPFAATLCFVVMPDHLHWLMQLDTGDLAIAVKRLKAQTTRNLRPLLPQPEQPIWQSSYYERALRREDDIQAVARYIVANPLRAGLVTSIRDYPLWDAIWL